MTTAPLIQRLFCKPAHGQPLLDASAGLCFERGHGIQGDVNADALSPRQVLVTRREDLDAFGLAPGELRENVVVSGLSDRLFVPGSCLRLGPEAAVRLTFHCEPCAQIAGRVALKAIVGRRGLLGVVVGSGWVQPGATLQGVPQAYAPVSDIPLQRFVAVLAQVPPGRVTTSLQILRAMGVQTSYARALPGYLRRVPADTPRHRLLDAQGRLFQAHVPKQAQLLAAEGVEVVAGAVSLAQFGWRPGPLYLT